MNIISRIPNGVAAKYDVEDLEFCNIVYMCIKQAGCSEYHIPDNIKSLVESVISDVYTLSPKLYNDDWTRYCYVTIKKMYVQPEGFGNRDGWHIDGYLSDQDNFIWSDCRATPTEVAIGEFDIADNHEQSLNDMKHIASSRFHQQLNTNTLYEMHQECVHRPTANKTENSVLHTFIKITYSKEMFNCIGNAWNYKIPHIRPTVKRGNIRNHTVK